VPAIFDNTKSEHDQDRTELRSLLSEAEFEAARRTTINAHYTDPRIAAQMWSSLRAMGFNGGQVLEPGSGSGTFIGLAPDRAHVTGVELDPVTARIAAALYPDATIRAESFADSRFATGTFDAAIGNVPFADVALHDKRHNAGRHSIHDHFIIKSLDLVRPGGMAMFLTSSFTMDRTNPAARREMAGLADLVGAVRLPTGTHRRTAGTEVVTDLLVFRRRDPDEPNSTVAGEEHPSWTMTQPRLVDGDSQHPIRVGGYFADHPEKVLGQLSVGSGMYGAQTVKVDGDLSTVHAQLEAALFDITEQAKAQHWVFTDRPLDLGPRQAASVPDVRHWAGHIAVHPDGGFTILSNTDGMEPLQVPTTQAVELRALLTLRDLGTELLTDEAANVDDTHDITRLRMELADRWRSYVDKYGPINRFSVTYSSKIDAETGEPTVTRRTPPVMRILNKDPFAPLVHALENFDEITQTARPATLLSERVVAPRPQILGADNPADALALTLNDLGKVDLDHVADLLGVDPATARAALDQLVFDDPTAGELVAGPEYLSGNVRLKLAQARELLPERPELAVNVSALEKVQPVDLSAEDITPRIGAAWISGDDHQQFLRELIGDHDAIVEHPGGTIWEVKANRWSVAATSEWGTGRRPAGDLLAAVLEQRTIVVTDTEDERQVLNTTETEAAREKASAMQERFGDWVWEDPQRADRLVTEYNRRFNSLALRDYTADGDRLTLPGLAKNFTPRPHQKAAVARMLAEPSVGLFHQVGAGKTAEMVIGAMELKRLGMANKPAVVVPNHMLEQFTREWLQLYPQARILAASTDDLAGDRRREFVARAATNDWDAVVMTQGAFSRIQPSPEGRTEYLNRELDDQRAILEAAKGTDHGLTVKRLEKTILRFEERMKAKLDGPKDPGIYFEETGLDYLIVDEAHMYKNLATISNISDAQIAGSLRATDMHMKIELLRERHGERVVTMATATPIANSVTEAHVMQRYLRPDLLRDADVQNFDSWAATFGDKITEMEMKPGGGFTEKTRLARYQNVPELLRMWQSFADVKTAEDLNLPTPLLKERPDGRRWPETVLIPSSPELTEHMRWIGREIEVPGGRDDPAKMLRLYHSGRASALDLRLVDKGEATGPTKLSVAADRIADIYQQAKDNEYLDDAGQPSATRGALQIVFCDLSVPGPKWNVYDQLRSDLVDRGLPADQIRFIHEAKNDGEKARLFAAARAGHVSVLVGSTAKMGVGTNVQARAIALHHLDCPWRPADLEQRDGRIMRQGNQNPEIQTLRYTVEGSFDSISYQITERKARMITQVIRGRLDVREIEDIGDSALSMAETKAITSGDPLVQDREIAAKEVARLDRLSRAYQNNQSALTFKAHAADNIIAAAERDEPALVTAIERTVSTKGDVFHATVGSLTTDERPAAADQLRSAITAGVQQYGLRRPEQLDVVVQLGGHDIAATQIPTYGGTPDIRFELSGVPRTAWTVKYSDVVGKQGVGIIQQMENRIGTLPNTLTTLGTERAAATTTAAAAREQLGRPFKYRDQLTAAHAQLDSVRAEMTAREVARRAGPATDGDGGAAVIDGPAAQQPGEEPSTTRPRIPGASQHSEAYRTANRERLNHLVSSLSTVGELPVSGRATRDTDVEADDAAINAHPQHHHHVGPRL